MKKGTDEERRKEEEQMKTGTDEERRKEEEQMKRGRTKMGSCKLQT